MAGASFTPTLQKARGHADLAGGQENHAPAVGLPQRGIAGHAAFAALIAEHVGQLADDAGMGLGDFVKCQQRVTGASSKGLCRIVRSTP